MEEVSEKISKLVFCRKCGGHTTHLIHPPAFEKKHWNYSEISQIIYCKICGTTVLEVFVQYLNESKTQTNPERFPSSSRISKPKFENNEKIIDLEIYQNYSDCIDCFNDSKFKASYLFLFSCGSLLADNILKKYLDQRLTNVPFSQKIKAINKISAIKLSEKYVFNFYSRVLKNYKKCLDPSFYPVIADIERGIELLSGYFNDYILDHKKVMNESAMKTIISLDYDEPLAQRRIEKHKKENEFE